MSLFTGKKLSAEETLAWLRERNAFSEVEYYMHTVLGGNMGHRRGLIPYADGVQALYAALNQYALIQYFDAKRNEVVTPQISAFNVWDVMAKKGYRGEVGPVQEGDRIAQPKGLPHPKEFATVYHMRFVDSEGRWYAIPCFNNIPDVCYLDLSDVKIVRHPRPLSLGIAYATSFTEIRGGKLRNMIEMQDKKVIYQFRRHVAMPAMLNLLAQMVPEYVKAFIGKNDLGNLTLKGKELAHAIAVGLQLKWHDELLGYNAFFKTLNAALGPTRARTQTGDILMPFVDAHLKLHLHDLLLPKSVNEEIFNYASGASVDQLYAALEESRSVRDENEKESGAIGRSAYVGGIISSEMADVCYMATDIKHITLPAVVRILCNDKKKLQTYTRMLKTLRMVNYKGLVLVEDLTNMHVLATYKIDVDMSLKKHLESRDPHEELKFRDQYEVAHRNRAVQTYAPRNASFVVAYVEMSDMYDPSIKYHGDQGIIDIRAKTETYRKGASAVWAQNRYDELRKKIVSAEKRGLQLLTRTGVYDGVTDLKGYNKYATCTPHNGVIWITNMKLATNTPYVHNVTDVKKFCAAGILANIVRAQKYLTAQYVTVIARKAFPAIPMVYCTGISEFYAPKDEFSYLVNQLDELNIDYSDFMKEASPEMREMLQDHMMTQTLAGALGGSIPAPVMGGQAPQDFEMGDGAFGPQNDAIPTDQS